MTRIIFDTRRPNAQENVSYVLDIYISADVLFYHLEELKNTLFTSLHFAPRFMYYSVSGIWMSVNVYRNEIKQNPHLGWVYISNLPIGNTGIPIQINMSDFIMNLIVTWVL